MLQPQSQPASPAMKTTALFALALTATLLGLRPESPRQQAWAPAADAGLGHSPLQPARAPLGNASPQAAPQPQALLTHARSGLAGAPAASDPAPAAALALAARPPGIAGESSSSLTDGPATPADWRDSALDLLSEIGLFCPTTGCDSLEDD